jgi:hypothetical protein
MKMKNTHKVIKSIKPILQWQVRKAEATGSKEITIDVEKAKELLNLAIASGREFDSQPSDYAHLTENWDSMFSMEALTPSLK